MVKASLGTFLKKGVQEKLGARTRSPLGAGAAETPGTVPRVRLAVGLVAVESAQGVRSELEIRMF